MATYRLILEYEGTRYHGWQEQRNARSVAGEVRRAVAAIVGEVLDLGGSGRTDAGVHALAQTAHLRLARPIQPDRLRLELNEKLPPDIHALAVVPEAERFHARHAAISRSYLYQVSLRRTAFGKRFVWWVKRPLDGARMAEAAGRVEGKHDFAQFCERPADQTSTLVEVERAEVAEAGSLILVRLVASHFLWKMVRRLVGVLVHVGAGEIEASDLEGLLEGRPLAAGTGSPAEWTAPPSGLFLERVTYPGDPPLPPIAPAFPVSREAAPAPIPAGALSPARAKGDGKRRPGLRRPSGKRGRAS